ncbi:GreA/GreB family elongation factor [Phototrophicus methaneseepsis]|uniref:GreA/GreB family elongation factor n=1 Tax=Phototrophicus methaneseepsis TaxID=2710758 RepID=A0A7S8E8K6_9CHLR|nr:GreA/GreB family elongation factor [Phototrophicus methaneseepsis]QPC82340.1 GreA/GreB family elongation factor [Phototrophicus methaneseepsis]
MAEEQTTLTQAGYDRLANELANLQQELREVIEELGDTHDDEGVGDSAQYSLATERERLQERIDYLKHVLETAQVIERAETDTVSVGNRITVLEGDEEFSFNLISQAEVINGQRGISNESPVGKALIGHKVGDKVKVETPDGIVQYTIRSIENIPDND